MKRALADGCDKVLVVLTQHREYVKSPTGQPSLYRRAFRDYPQMIRVLDERHTLYNDTRAWLWELEKTGKAVVVAPAPPSPSAASKSGEAAWTRPISSASGMFSSPGTPCAPSCPPTFLLNNR